MNHKGSTMLTVMFIGSIIIGFFITSSLLVDKSSHIRPSLTKFYQALFMALWMVLLEAAMHPQTPISVYLLTFVGIIAVWMLARDQVGVNDQQYLKSMIQHHSSAILTSEKILKKSNDSQVRELAENIIRSQEEEIRLMNQILEN